MKVSDIDLDKYVQTPVEGIFPTKPEDASSLFALLNTGLIPNEESSIKRYAMPSDPSKGYFYVPRSECRRMSDEEKAEWADIVMDRKAKAQEKRLEDTHKREKAAVITTASFTGRRPKDLCGYDWNGYREFGKQFVEYLNTLYKSGTKNFITGGAQGFDQIAFWAVSALKKKYGYTDVKNIVYVPFEGQDRIWKDKGAFSREEYGRMLSQADEVKLLVSASMVNDFKIAQYLLDRNKAMVNDSDFVIALYPDDTYKTNTGGTSACMRYASEQGKEIRQVQYHLDNKTLCMDEVITIPAAKKEEKAKKKPYELDIEQLSGKNIVCFDTETTGFGKRDEILQLTITSFKDGEPEVIYSGYFNPEHVNSWPDAMAINHITPAMVRNKPYIKDCISDFKHIFEEADMVVGYNVNYDIRMLNQSIGEGQIDIPTEKVWDVCTYFKKAEPKEGHKLIEAMQFYCPDKMEWFEENAHDASADALATLHVLKAEAEREGIDLFPEERSLL